MAKQRLTDRQRISGVTLTDLLHFVVTGDTSQSPAGSSYKGEVGQLFDAFSSYTCTNPLIVDTVNACNSGITINGNVTINGSATTINTEVIQSKDNNIILNYSGTHATALYGGITVEDGQSEGVDSSLFIDEDGCWHADPGFCDLTVDGIPFTAQTPYLFVDDGSVNSITTRYTGNTVTDSDYSNIGGGKDNTIDPGSDYSNIAGGLNNLIDDYTRYSVIGGGNSNQILGGEGYYNSNAIVGGERNTIDVSYFSNIAGGSGNTIDSSYYSSIGGGRNNSTNGSYTFIGSGKYNQIVSTADPFTAMIVGGQSNTISLGKDTTIVGGVNNGINIGVRGFIGGGGNNYIGDTTDAVIAGGLNNRISGNTSSIVGGQNNVVSHTNSHIIGSNITSISANTTHVERFNIGTIDNNESLNDVLVRDTDGTVRYRSSQSIADSFTGNTSGTCITDLFVSNIHSCSPLNINPLNEGNVYFGSTSGVTIDLTNNYVGVGESNPDRRLVVSGSKATLFVDTDEQDPLAATTPGNRIFFEGNPSGSTRMSFVTETNVGVSIGQLGSLADSGNLGLGNPLDSFIYSNSQANNLNIITKNGAGTDDNIRFYTGLGAEDISGTTSAVHIQGNGSTIGYVGINNENPEYRLDILGTTGRLWYDGDSDRNQYRQSQIYNEGPSTGITAISVFSEGEGNGIELFSVGSGVTTGGSWQTFGQPTDVALYATTNANNLNIINNNGIGKEDNIRFYAGGSGPLTAQTSAMHIHGDGSNRGYIGINNENPTERLDVSGKTKTTNFQMTSGGATGYVLSSIDNDGNAQWGNLSSLFTGNTSGDCITDLYVTNLYGCSPLHIEPSGLNDVYIVENGGGMVGVGTSAPTARLHISGNTRHSGDIFMDNGEYIEWNDNTGIWPTSVNNKIRWRLNNDYAEIYAWQPSSNDIDFVFKLADDATTSTDNYVFWIDSSLGEVNDRYPLEMNGEQFIVNPTRKYAVSPSNSGASRTNFYVLKSGATALSESILHANVITNRVGVNTSSPTETLDVNGNTIISGTLNIGTVDTGSTATEVLVRETNGIVNTVNLSTFTQQKYAASIPFTAATSQTVTHNLNDTDVIVQLKDSTGTLVIPDVVDNYTNNTVDIQVSSTETFRVIIIG